MTDDKRFRLANAEAIIRFRTAKCWTINELAKRARYSSPGKQTHVSVDSVKRAENTQDPQWMQLRVLSAIACALGRKPWEICLGSSADFLSPNEDSYSWDDIKRGAEEVAKRIYINEELQVDAVLTFPGASSIFCGYVMRLLPLEVFMRLPLYTAIFVDAHTSVSERSTYYWPVHCKLFTILLPRELIEDPLKRIVVIDDCILTGGAMDKLVEFFTERHNRDNVQFACCICFVGRSLANSQLPEIIGLPDLDNQIKIGLPWGDSYCFEDAFKRQ